MSIFPCRGVGPDNVVRRRGGVSMGRARRTGKVRSYGDIVKICVYGAGAIGGFLGWSMPCFRCRGRKRQLSPRSIESPTGISTAMGGTGRHYGRKCGSKCGSRLRAMAPAHAGACRWLRRLSGKQSDRAGRHQTHLRPRVPDRGTGRRAHPADRTPPRGAGHGGSEDGTGHLCFHAYDRRGPGTCPAARKRCPTITFAVTHIGHGPVWNPDRAHNQRARHCVRECFDGDSNKMSGVQKHIF